MAKRSDEEYENESLTRGLLVLEALEGTAWQPVTAKTVMDRTGLSRDQVDRSLKTLRLRGYAVCENGKWTVGKRLIRIAQSIASKSL